MAETSSQDGNVAKKSLPLAAKIGIGCVIVLVVVGTLLSVLGSVLFSKFGIGLMQKGLEEKTGLKVDSDDTGTFTVTDKKTGSTLDVGSGQIPASFPKDFPVYPGAKVAGSMTGKGSGGEGTFVSFTTTDGAAKVTAYYDKELAAKGWTVAQTVTSGDSSSRVLSKDAMGATLVITGESSNKETSIVVTLSPQEKSEEMPTDNSGENQ